MTLNEAEFGKEYTVTKVDVGDDEELKGFLFSLGCYEGEKITVVDKKKNLVVSINDEYDYENDFYNMIKNIQKTESGDSQDDIDDDQDNSISDKEK